MIVVADTSPINYLILIEHIDLLPALYDQILVPPEVIEELRRFKAPEVVRRWASNLPGWVSVAAAKSPLPSLPFEIDRGESAALALAVERRARIIIDERLGRQAAEALGLQNIGTLGVLRDASLAGLVDLDDAVAKLQQTSFRVSAPILQALLDKTR